MLTLTKKLPCNAKTTKKPECKSNGSTNNYSRQYRHSRISVRDKLLMTEVQEMENTLPTGCKVKFDDPNALHDFCLTISPDEGFWMGGKFRFQIHVGEDYNIAPPQVKCRTRLWHPNISEDGEICLSILRQTSIDGIGGWTPTRHLRDVIWGLNSLFTDLLNFDDPINAAAAEDYQQDKDAFRLKTKQWIRSYCT